MYNLQHLATWTMEINCKRIIVDLSWWNINVYIQIPPTVWESWKQNLFEHNLRCKRWIDLLNVSKLRNITPKNYVYKKKLHHKRWVLIFFSRVQKIHHDIVHDMGFVFFGVIHSGMFFLMDILIQALMPFFSTQVPDAQFDIDIPRAARLLDLENGSTTVSHGWNGVSPWRLAVPALHRSVGSIKCDFEMISKKFIGVGRKWTVQLWKHL